MSKAYFGGVTEVFKPLIKNGFHYDVNSLYPFVMRNLMPIGPHLIVGSLRFL